MKTMKLLVMFMALSLSTSVMAQSSVQAKLKENRAALKKENVSKDAKKEAKRLKKEGWTKVSRRTAPGEAGGPPVYVSGAV